jgi:protein Mpv17
MLSSKKIIVALLAAFPATIAWMPSHPIASISSLSTRLSSSSPSLTRLRISVVENSVTTDRQYDQALPQEEEIDAEIVDVVPYVEPPLDTTQRTINALFLTASFGYALYTIFNIDHGMTRGWSASEIAMRIPLDNWENYESSLANSPIFTKTAINVIIYLLGDWLSQTVFQKNHVLDFDITRTLRNGFIGLCFGPLVHEYYQFSDSILPPEDGMFIRFQKILMDQTLYLTVKCTIYIAAVGLLGGDDLATVKKTIEDKIGDIVVSAWKFWPLVHCITYGLVPARHRILWVNTVDLFWNAILASKAQKVEDSTDVAYVVESAVEEADAHVVHDQKDIDIPPVVVLDNQWAQDQKEELTEIIVSNNNHQTNMTADAQAA